MKPFQPKLVIFFFKVLNKWAKLDSVILGEHVASYFDSLENDFEKCGDLKRLGSVNDGGYLTFNDISENDIALSFGIGNNFSWDVECAKRVSKVMMFDHTIEEPIGLLANMDFYPCRISGTESSKHVTNLTEIMSKHSKEQEYILKIDIEGAEWPVLDAISKTELSQMKQIIIEFHNILRMILEGNAQEIKRMIDKLKENHVLVNYHPNNYGLTMQIGGFQVSDVIEVTFVRRDILAQSIIRNKRRISNGNMPNDPNRAEVKSNHLIGEILS